MGRSPTIGTSADLHARWQALQLFSPVFSLLERAAPRAGFQHRGYDLAQLSLRLIDYVVQHQASLEGSVSPAAAVDHLTQAARRMHPKDPDRSWAKVAKLVFSSMMNDGRPHEVIWVDADGIDDQEPRTEPFRFRLLRLVDSESGAAVTATDQAIVLYLQALNADLADRALALKLMVEIQMNAGAYNKALETAREATRTARGLSASLREKLVETRRDVGAVDWHGEMPAWLTASVEQVTQQLDQDRQLLQLAEQAASDPSAGDTCRQIQYEVKAGQDVWIKLEKHLQQAIPVFLEAQATQRFQPRGLAAAVDMSRDVLDPLLTADETTASIVTERLVAAVAPPVAPTCWGLGELCDALLRAPVVYDRGAQEIDEPGELGEAVGDSIPDDIATCVADLLSRATQEPTRLSELISSARARADEVDDPVRLLDVLWGAALWVFVAGSEAAPDSRPQRADLAAAVGALTAAVDTIGLDDHRFSGPDLILATTVALDQLDLHESGAA